MKLVTLVGSAALLVPSAAAACGGLFCSQSPVDQSGESIVFATHEDDGHGARCDRGSATAPVER